MGSFLGTPAPKTFSEQLRRNGMGTFSLELSLFVPLVLFYLIFVFLLGGIASVLLPAVSFTGFSVLYLGCTALCFAAYTQFIYSFTKNAGRGLLLFLFLGLFMIVVGGGFLPYAFLPDICSRLTPYLPLSAALSGLRRLAGGVVTLQDSLILFCHALLLFGALAALSALRRKEVRS